MPHQHINPGDIFKHYKGKIMTSPFSFQFPKAVNDVILQAPHYITASDNIRLAYYDFVPTQPKAIIIFYHGGGAWSNQLYQYMAQELHQKYNVGTYLFDIRGHGNSQGPRGDAPSTKQVWQDISSAINFVYQKHPDLKIFLGGHSSGAGLILNYSGWNQHPAVSGYILLAPFLGSQSKTAYDHHDPQKNFIKHVRIIPLILNHITKGLLFARTPVVFFNYPEQEKQRDTYLLEYYTSSMAQATTPYDPQMLFKRLNKPFLLVIGECDEQFIPEKVVSFCTYAQTVKDQSHCQIIPNSTHLSIVVETTDTIGQYLQSLDSVCC